MKKFLIVLSVLVLTGCGNKIVCTKETDEEQYITEEKISFEFDKDDKVTNASVDYTMIFENEKDAESYSKVFESLNDDFNIKLDGKKLTISSTKNYQEYQSNKKELKEDLEKDGYTCK